MALEPTSVQRDRLLSRGKTKLVLVQFLVGKDSGNINEYLSLSRQAVLNEGGHRDHQLQIDQTLVGGEHSYQYLTVDSFPSSQALLLAHEGSREVRQETMQEVYGIYLKPNSTINKAVKAAGVFAPTLARWLDTQEVKVFPKSDDVLDPDTDPDTEAVREFSTRDQDQPFYMMNLNQFAPQQDKRYLTGHAAYKRYSLLITPYLISVGGYPVVFDEPLGTYIGDSQSSLLNSWGEFGLVYYPSRANFLRLMTNTPQRAAEYRRAGFEKAVLMPCITDSRDL
jgi:hypothetical protein